MRARENGFTLIEVLVAFTILALALGVLLPTFSSGLAAQSRAEAHATTVLQAQSKLAEVGALIALEAGTTAGDYNDGATWQVEIVPYHDDALEQTLPTTLVAYAVTVSVWRDGDAATTLSTLRMGAAP